MGIMIAQQTTLGLWVAMIVAIALALIGIAGACIYVKNPAKQEQHRNVLEVVRSKTGYLAVIAGDLVLIGVAVLGAYKTDDPNQAVAVLTSSATAVTAITTSFFGIRAASNTAAKAIAQSTHPDAKDEQPPPGDRPA
ncbi:hypothetical protein ACFWB1_25970 [Streptomyces goshikiensis]|uniref:hypothetical protein n=1 Tax=Streptomyces goshikiensis TaxID=1942 RepID=UPI0036AD9844